MSFNYQHYTSNDFAAAVQVMQGIKHDMTCVNSAGPYICKPACTCVSL